MAIQLAPQNRELERNGMKMKRAKSKSVDDATLENSLGYLVRDTHRLIGKVLNARLERVGIRVGHWYILRSLLQEEGITQRELSTRIGMNEPNVVTSLRVLEKKDIISRIVDEKDGRCKRVGLTNAGRALALSLLPIVHEVNDIIGAPLNDEERAQLISLVKRVRQGLE
ncbi:MarR family transcriptional regulator [uncultured Parasphingorhabdus sp.]|uniref:MarR family winged helix-turn-helix transcriptional regulator n=1 Tax=uncultured Parasphingorhabdus sp. TaxID=2709694 RepID=UPI0030D90B09|tara:strand:+ start:56637 stop:57143 length:507 start_codon:yes stop_codon:yes gene_type:complete